MKKTLSSLMVMVCLLVCPYLSAQSPLSQNGQLTVSRDNILLDVKVTNFLFKKIDSGNYVVEFRDEDVDFLRGYFLQKEGVIEVNAQPLDKTIEVVSLLQKEGKILFQHRQIVGVLQKMGYAVIQMNCKREHRYMPVNQILVNELFPNL